MSVTFVVMNILMIIACFFTLLMVVYMVKDYDGLW